MRLYPGPTLMWGGEAKTEHGVTVYQRFETTNFYGLTAEGRVFALAYDHGTPGGALAWMRIGGPA